MFSQVSLIVESAFAVTNSGISVSEIVEVVSPADTLSCSNDCGLHLLGIVSLFATLAPSAFTGAFLAELFRLFIVHFFWFCVHFEHLVEVMS